MAIFTKIVNSLIRLLQWLGTMYCIGTGSYYIYKLSKGHHSPNAKAIFIEAASGAAFVYVSFMLLLQLCLAQKTFFKFFTVIWDLIFMGAFITIAILLRGISGQHCGGRATTPSPPWWNVWEGVRPSIKCKLTKTFFGDAIGLAGLFAISAVVALLARDRKETRYDNREATHTGSNRKAAGAGLLGLGARKYRNRDNRQSVETGYTRDMIDEEKASDIGAGQTYGRTQATVPANASNNPRIVEPVPAANPPRLSTRNNTERSTASGQGLAAPAIAHNRTASPMSSMYEDNRGSTHDYNQQNANEGNYAAYNGNTNQQQTYNTGELAAADYDNSKLGRHNNIDHHTGPLIENVHQRLGVNHG